MSDGLPLAERRSQLLLLQAAEKTVAMVKSDKDNRYSSSEITTHDGVARSCYAVAQLADLRSAVGQSYDSIQVIAIDEAQFFPDLLEFCTEASEHENKHIVVAGLDGDFQRQRFGQVGVADDHFFCMASSGDTVAFGAATGCYWCKPTCAVTELNTLCCYVSGAGPHTCFRQRHQANSTLCLLRGTCLVFTQNCS